MVKWPDFGIGSVKPASVVVCGSSSALAVSDVAACHTSPTTPSASAATFPTSAPTQSCSSAGAAATADPAEDVGVPAGPPARHLGKLALLATQSLKVATWNANGLFVHHSYDQDKYKKKLAKIRRLLDTCTVVAIQESHGTEEDLQELLKLWPDVRGYGTFHSNPAAGGSLILVRRSFSSSASSSYHRPLEPGRSLQLLLHFPGASLNLICIHSDPSQAAGVRRHWLRLALGTRSLDDSELTIALGDFNLTLPGDYRLDISNDTRDYATDSLGTWLHSEMGDFRAVGYEGFSRAGRSGGVLRYFSAIDLVLSDLRPLDLIDIRPSAHTLGKISDPLAVSDHIPVIATFPQLGPRPASRRGWPKWLFNTSEFQDAIAGPNIKEKYLNENIDYARGMLQATCSRALAACSRRPASSDAERLHWALVAMRALRDGSVEVTRRACLAVPELRQHIVSTPSPTTAPCTPSSRICRTSPF